MPDFMGSDDDTSASLGAPLLEPYTTGALAMVVYGRAAGDDAASRDAELQAPRAGRFPRHTDPDPPRMS